MTCHCQDIATKDGKPRGIVGSTARGEVKQASMDHGRAAGEPLFGPSSVSGRLQAATNTTQQHRQFWECDITDSTVPGVDIRCLCHAFATNTAEIPLFCFGSSPLIAPKKPRRGALNRQNLDSASSTRLSGQTRHRASHGSQHALHRRIEKRASASAPIFQVSTTESPASDVAALGPRLQSQYTGTAAFVLCRSGAESFQPGRRPRTPESRDPDGRRATEGSAVSRFQSRRGQTRARLKTEKTVAVPRSTVVSIAWCSPMQRSTCTLWPQTPQSSRSRPVGEEGNPTPTDWIPGPNLSTRPSCHQSPHGHLQSANACAPRQYSNIGVASEWLRILDRGSVA